MICLDINFGNAGLGDSYMQSRLRTSDLMGEENEKLISSSVVPSASALWFVISSHIIDIRVGSDSFIR